MLTLSDEVGVYLGILDDLVGMAVRSQRVSTAKTHGFVRFKQPFHARPQRFGIDIPSEPSPLQCKTAGMKIPRVGHDERGFENAVASFFGDILEEDSQPSFHAQSRIYKTHIRDDICTQ
jgi:hypothetical protein